jgi:hypothetical protein
MTRETVKFALIFFIGIALLTLLLPVELYDGYAVLENGDLVNEKLSLSYLVNKESFLQNYKHMGVQDIRLHGIGWILVGIVNIGIPFLLGYRVAIARHKKRDLL